MVSRVRRIGTALSLSVMGALGCGSSGDPGAGAQACEDMAGTLASAAVACGLDYQANYDFVVNLVADGRCANIKGLRDHDSFYGECLPFLMALTCDQLNSATVTFPDSCKGQLER